MRGVEQLVRIADAQMELGGVAWQSKGISHCGSLVMLPIEKFPASVAHVYAAGPRRSGGLLVGK
ncbi:hypothetical protein GCM10010433_49980 [Streptomyces pulveraceus]